MRRTKTLLKRINPEVAQRRRECDNSGREIVMGESCLVVFDGPRRRFCYSREVGLRMIERARDDLEALEGKLRR
jgi:hypothetical protein